MTRRLDRSDGLIAALDEGLRTLAGVAAAARPSPAQNLDEPALSSPQRRVSAALMRVNHAGEIAAQALYVGQAIGARRSETRSQLLEAAREERDHLDWCRTRLDELDARPSLLAPFWYAGSFGIGLAAGSFSDAISLGFVAETEQQVEAHLKDHLARLPAGDDKSRAILETMAADEAHHGTSAMLAGGVALPALVRGAMSIGGEILRRTAYFL